NASLDVISQPGDYEALLTFHTNTPYQFTPVSIEMDATPPNTWGKIAGTVLGVRCDGSTAPLAGATVQIDTWAAHYTLKTDANGDFGLWLDVRNNPLTIIVAKDGYSPKAGQVRIKARQATSSDWQLTTTTPCN